MKYLRNIFLLLLTVLAVQATAQSRSTELTIQVSSIEGDNLDGQVVTLIQTDYQVSYGTLTLDADGRCVVKVYAGNHRLELSRNGFNAVAEEFAVADGEASRLVEVMLTEKTRTPYALQAVPRHNAYDGKNSIALSWNTEAPAFFDDFESYEPFAVTFGQWTGIDADLEAAAPLVGSYPNRGVMQYAQIINPLTVEPTWWYDYPILRPYSGLQYVGFTRTSSGNANDDWLITPAITVGTDNVFTFMAKAADQYPERFMVYATTVLGEPSQADFVRLDQDNYETADYRGWRQYTYDLTAYAGQQVRLAIRYISHYNRYGSFMLMVDDVYVGQPLYNSTNSRSSYKSRRLCDSRRSPANPNEQFYVFLDGQQVGTTDGYDYLISDVAAGSHTLGVQAVYKASQTETTTITVDIPAADYSHLTFNVTANSVLSPDGQQFTLLSMETAETYTLTVTDGQAEILSLPNGRYTMSVDEGAFQAYQQTLTVAGDATVAITLEDHIVDPYNITAMLDDDGNLTVRWNQELIFTDSFEDYDDFATGTFGQWKSVDMDRQPVYPIGLGGTTNVVSFPGSGTATNPTAIAPMVFNPWMTSPAMLPVDPAIAAPTGNKSIIFFSPQRYIADKWLISPLLDIHDGYVLNVTAKGYSSMYPESMEFCVSDGSDNPSDFTAVSQVDNVSSEQWTIYQTDLAAYAGQRVRLAVHYNSYDAFLAQIDDFTVGPEDGQGEVVDYGNVLRYDIYLDGDKVAETTTPTFFMTDVDPGRHVVGIRAIYQNGQSQLVEYVVEETAGIVPLATLHAPLSTLYDLQGRRVTDRRLQKGLYIKNGKKLIVR